MKSRLLAGTAAVALALVGALIMIAYANGAEQRAMASMEVKDVLVVTKAIPAGTAVSDLAGSLVIEKVPAKAVSATALSTLDHKTNTVAAVDLLPGEQLLEARLVPAAEVTDDKSMKVPAGFQEVSFQLEPQRVVGGNISVGDHVGVAMSFRDGVDKGKPAGASTQLTLRKVLVTAVQRAPQAAAGSDDAKAENTAVPDGLLIVTVAVNDIDANKIVFTSEFGTIWLTKEPLDAQDSGPRIEHLDTVYK
ncbi:Flp pilus assembly protein CpaB [Pseudarthrobacter enclensis]|uniref:Flp pilus assembly protein CpaB n=1 Tax=Pseudarthrobacter enclensis TaxID=993070 RepID=UPI003EE2ADD2